jgi:hypothetical protein
LIAAIVLLGVLVAPVVLRGHGSSCSLTLRYAGRTYAARDVRNAHVVQSIAVGVGVLSGCGSSPQNANIRSILGLPPAFAVGLPTEASTLFVERGRCSDLTGPLLVRCLRG